MKLFLIERSRRDRPLHIYACVVGINDKEILQLIAVDIILAVEEDASPFALRRRSAERFGGIESIPGGARSVRDISELSISQM